MTVTPPPPSTPQYGPAVVGMCYITSFLFSMPSTSATAIIAFGIINIVVTIVASIFTFIESTWGGVWVGGGA